MDAIPMLQRLSGGRFIGRLGDAVAEVSNVVRDFGGKGQVVVTLSIERGAPESAMVTIVDAIQKKIPARKGEGAYFYAHEGALHLNDPRQAELEGLHDVTRRETSASASAAEVADEATGSEAR